MDYLASLEQKLKDGLYVNNLKQLVSLCNEAKKKENTLAFHTLESVFSGVLQSFDERALPTSELQHVQSKLSTPVSNLIKKLRNGDSEKEIFQSLTELVQEYINLYDDFEY